MSTPGSWCVVDTNVVVSGVISAGRGSPSSLILDEMLAGRLRFVVSVDLLVEYRAVLLRPRIRSFHRLSEDEVDRLVERIVANGSLREPPNASSPAPDPNDQHLWSLLEAVPGSVLVTGDQALLAAPPEGGSVISPRSYVALRLGENR